MPQDGILPSTDETSRQGGLTPDQIARIKAAPSPPPVTYARGLAPPAGTLPANFLDNGYAAILGTQPGFGNLSVAPPTAGANGAPSPAAAPVDASGRSTMPINADPSLYGPGTPGAAANQHFGPGPPTRLTPQQPTGGRASTITPKAEGGAALGSIISFQPSDDFSQQTGISAEDYDRYRGYLAQNESQRYDQPPSRTGKADPPWVAGRYQMGPGEIAQAASELGIPNPSIQQFLASPELQEQLFQQYTLDHHRELMQYPMYANGDAATRMALLAGRHLGGLDAWMKGGDPHDNIGTHTSKYINGMYAVATGKVDGIAHPGAAGAAYSTDPAIQSIQTQLQQYRADATRLLQTELEEFNKLKAGSPEADAQLRKLADRQIADLDAERQMAMSPPIEKPADIFANFGSLATVVGVLGGMLSRRGMVASLDAAGAAMEAINTNNHEQWKDAFDTWKAKTTLMANLLGHESAIYKDILDNKRLDWDEKLGLLQTRFGIEQNILGQQYAATGDMAKIIEMTQKQQEIADKHRETVANAEVEEGKRDAERAVQSAAKAADEQWLNDPANADYVKLNGRKVPAQVHLANLAQAQGQMTQATAKGGAKSGEEREIADRAALKNRQWDRDHPNASPDERDQAHSDNELAARHEVSAAGSKAGGDSLEASKQYEIVEEKTGNVIGPPLMLRERKNAAGFVHSEGGAPLELEPGQRVRQITPTQAGGGRAGQQVLRQIVGGREVLSDLQNVSMLPIGQTTSSVYGFDPGKSLWGILEGDLLRHLTDQDAALMQTSMAGLQRELSILQSPVYVTQGSIDQLDKLVPMKGDTRETALFKVARSRQVADNALEGITKSPLVSNREREYAKEMRAQLHKYIPYTSADINEWVQSKKSKTESFGAFLERNGIPRPPQPPTTPAINFLREHPETRTQFDEKYGAGAAASALEE